MIASAFISPLALVAVGAAFAVGDHVAETELDNAIDKAEALVLARRICAEWLQDFTTLVPRSVGQVIDLLERLQSKGDKANDGEPTLLDTLSSYSYGLTPMNDVLKRSVEVFKEYRARYSVLVLVSDGLSTDGDPEPYANQLRRMNVTMATAYLTNRATSHRRLHYLPAEGWQKGQKVLFAMATKTVGVQHPIPALACAGWKVPSEGEVALHATLKSSEALDEFCSLLLSDRLGSTLLETQLRISYDAYLNDKEVLRCRDPSDQGNSGTCYAHAVAAVVNMAIHRIIGREGGYPSIGEIRAKILQNFPPRRGGRNTRQVLSAAVEWYRLEFREINEDGARQALLRRRPVLATFHLSQPGWDRFGKHFQTKHRRALSPEDMAEFRSPPSGGGHAVVLTDCSPASLTFLNSWGEEWGKNGSFSVKDCTVLEVDGIPATFYDVYWLESKLLPSERQEYTRHRE